MISFELLLILGLNLVAIKAYFQIARRYKIYDVPNHRTLHDGIIIRGGGVIIPISVLFYAVIFNDYNWYLLSGLVVVSVLSFIDDLNHVPTTLRVVIQFTCVALILSGISFYDLGWEWYFIALVVAAGTINAYNFMDGINGITGGYSFIAVITLIILNTGLSFVQPELLWSVMCALIVFNYFNFRKQAMCFAGDVGSISIAFLIVYFILKLILHTQNPIYILLLSVYGVDSVLTIIYRLIKRENIFEAHRSHLFQLVVFHGNKPHLLVSFFYMLVQALINYLVIVNVRYSVSLQFILSITILIILSLVYLALRNFYMRKNR